MTHNDTDSDKLVLITFGCQIETIHYTLSLSLSLSLSLFCNIYLTLELESMTEKGASKAKLGFLIHVLSDKTRKPIDA